MNIHVSWIEDDGELIYPLTRRLEEHAAELGVELRATRHPLGFGIDLRSELDDADVILLMISPAYLESRSARTQIDLAHERQLNGATVMAILVRAGGDLSRLPPALLPVIASAGMSIADATDRDAIYDEIVDRVRDVIMRVRQLPRATVTQVAPEVAATFEVESPASAPSEVSEPDPPTVSESTRFAIKDLGGDVEASAIVTRLLKIHEDYGGEIGARVQLGFTRTKRSVSDWLRQVRDLYDIKAVALLDGRHVIHGLALLDPDLRKQLLQHGFLHALEDELKPPLELALSPAGRKRWAAGTVRTLADRPAKEDQLERRHFAKGLADMIKEERSTSTKESGHPESFLVHLHGPWGSGKTSLLGFLRDELDGHTTSADPDSRWVVVEFNAWQHERLGAPWWSLMTAVHREGLRAPFGETHATGRQRRRELWRSLRLLWFDLWWRVRLGWAAYLLLPVVLGLLVFGWQRGWFDAPETTEGLAKAGDIAKPIAAIIGLIVALLGAARGLGRSLSVGSARGAETFMKTSRDPMRTLRKRYEKLVSTIGRPVAVFIDDLDRCQSSYVVEVLQGVQTLLIEAPVTYVVAADRRWLYDSYAKVYSDFPSAAREPGRPLGHLFLEKTFQLSASLPALPEDVVDTYWGILTGPGSDGTPAADAKAVQQAVDEASVAGLDEVAAGATGDTPAQQRAQRVVLAEQIATPEVQEEIENRLKPFAHLLEPNPRAMKRLINAYQIELRRLLAEGRRVGRASVTPEEIALWTILALRWPLLADQIALQPDGVEATDDKWLPSKLRPLWGSDPVQSVVKGDDVPALLTTRSVRALVGRSHRPEAVPPAAGNGMGAVPSVA